MSYSVTEKTDQIKNQKEIILNSWRILFDKFFIDEISEHNSEVWLNNLFSAVIYSLEDKIDYSLLDFSLENYWGNKYTDCFNRNVRIENFMGFLDACLAVINNFLDLDDNKGLWFLKNFVCFSFMLSSYDKMIVSLGYNDTIINDLEVFILCLDHSFNIVWMNNNAKLIFPQFIIGEKCTSNLLYTNANNTYCMDNQDKSEGKSNKGDFLEGVCTIETSDNKIIRAFRSRFNGHLFIFGQDISTYSFYKEKIDSMENKIQFLLNSNFSPMLILDSEGKISIYGRPFIELMREHGVFQAEYNGKTLEEIPFFSNNSSVFLAIKNYLKNQKVLEAQIQGIGLDGTKSDFLLKANNIYFSDQKTPAGSLIIIEEVTEMSILEKKSLYYKDICEAIVSMVGGFLLVIDSNYNILFCNDPVTQAIGGKDNLQNIENTVIDYVMKILQENKNKEFLEEIFDMGEEQHLQISIKKIKNNERLIHIEGVNSLLAEFRKNLSEEGRDINIFKEQYKK